MVFLGRGGFWAHILGFSAIDPANQTHLHELNEEGKGWIGSQGDVMWCDVSVPGELWMLLHGDGIVLRVRTGSMCECKSKMVCVSNMHFYLGAHVIWYSLELMKLCVTYYLWYFLDHIFSLIYIFLSFLPFSTSFFLLHLFMLCLYMYICVDIHHGAGVDARGQICRATSFLMWIAGTQLNHLNLLSHPNRPWICYVV